MPMKNCQLTILRNQHGRFSPFMFGMLIGVSVFSASVSHLARKELKETEERNKRAEVERAADIKRALTNAILTENIQDVSNTYSEKLDIDRAKRFITRSVGKTKGGEDYQLTARETTVDNELQNTRILINISDDRDLATEIANITNADEMINFNTSNSESIATFDTKAVRQRQIDTSIKYLRMEESQLYRYYTANGFKFPGGQGEYEEKVNSITLVKDAWGATFKYNRIDDKNCSIKFTTPWNYTHTIKLKMD